MTRDHSDLLPRSTAEIAYGRDASNGAPSDDQQVGRNYVAEQEHAPLISPEKSSGYSDRWRDVQAEFVDEPQRAVREADGLVAEVIQTLAATFADQRKTLEEQWSDGSEVSTEDLRQALMQYRAFFQRLLAT